MVIVEKMKFGQRLLLALVGMVTVACTTQSAMIPTAQTRVVQASLSQQGLPQGACFDSVVLVALDGVRSKDVFSASSQAGSPHFSPLPELSAMQEEGAAWGAPGSNGFFASGPNYVSLPGYMEMLSGSIQLSCTENDCTKMKRRTLFDDFTSRYPSEASGVIASWPKIATAASQSNQTKGFISTGADLKRGNHGLGPQSQSSLRRARRYHAREDGYRHDRGTAQVALSYFDEAQPRFLFVGLGDTDEYAHKKDLDGYRKALTFADAFIGEVRSRHASLRRRGMRTLLLVTTDHGRANSFAEHGRKHPESAQSFLLAEGSGIPKKGAILAGPRRYLRDIAPTLRAVCGFSHTERGGGQILTEMF